MALKCCAYGCSNKENDCGDTLITFHRFPVDKGNEKLLNGWKKATGDLKYTVTKNSAFCSEHFQDSDFVYKDGTRTLQPESVPTKFVKPATPSKDAQAKGKVSSNTTDEPAINPFVEIHGLNPTNQSDLNMDIRRIAEFFGVKIQQNQIDCSFIIKRKNQAHTEVVKETIIVKFGDLKKKRELIDAFKNSENTLVDSDRSEPIFLAEELSNENKHLLRVTAGFKQVGSFVLSKNPIQNIAAQKGIKPQARKVSGPAVGNVSSKKALTKSLKSNAINISKPVLRRAASAAGSKKSSSAKFIVNEGTSKHSVADIQSLLDDLQPINETDQTSPTVQTKKVAKTESSYDDLLSDASEKSLKVTLERLDDETIQKLNSPGGKRSKPFKKRFSTENANDNDGNSEVEDSEVKKGRGGKKKSTPSSHEANDNETESTGLSKRKRRIVKPSKYSDEYVYYSEEFQSVKNKKANNEYKAKNAVQTDSENNTKSTASQNKRPATRKSRRTASSSSLESSDSISAEVGAQAKKAKTSVTEGNRESIPSPIKIFHVSKELFPVKDKVTPSPRPLRTVPNVNKKDKKSVSTPGAVGVKDPFTGNAGVTVIHGFTPVPNSGGLVCGQVDKPLAGSVPVLHQSTPSIGQQASVGASNGSFKLITNFEQLISHLKERHVLESHLEELLVRNFSGYDLYLILRCRDQGKTKVEFSELQIKFALTVYLHSIKCFRYLNNVFLLPSEASLDSKVSSRNFEPGLLVEYLQYIDDRVTSSENLVDCFLVVDTVPLSSASFWDWRNTRITRKTKVKKWFDLFESEAHQILMVMVCSMNGVMNVPVAYFPVDDVHPAFLARLIHICVGNLFERKVKVWSVVLDASENSFSAARCLGCSFELDNYLTTLFTCTRCPHRIAVIFDSCHLRRLARDCLTETGIIDSNMGYVEWKYIKLINEKLSNRTFDDRKRLFDSLMSLNLNLSLAKAIEVQKKRGNTIFACSQPTIDFIKELDRFFSMLEYPPRNFSSEITRGPPRKFYRRWFPDISVYLRSLKIENREIYKHSKYLFVIGLFVTLNGIGYIYDKIKTKHINAKTDLIVHKLTVDPIDLFYQRIFKSRTSLPFREGLADYFSRLSSDHLAFTDSPSLVLDFKSDKRSFRVSPDENKIRQINNKLKFDIEMLNNSNVRLYSDLILSRISDRICESISRTVTCLHCRSMLIFNNDVATSAKSDLDHVYSSYNWRKELNVLYDDSPIRASNDVLAIVKISETAFHSVQHNIKVTESSIELLRQTLTNRIRMECYENFTCRPFSIFKHPVLEDVTYVTHEAFLTKLIIENYLKVRLSKLDFLKFLFK